MGLDAEPVSAAETAIVTIARYFIGVLFAPFVVCSERTGCVIPKTIWNLKNSTLAGPKTENL
jgi:hypothetical protein